MTNATTLQHTPGKWERDRNTSHTGQIAVLHGCLNSDWIEIWSPKAFQASEETQEANAQLMAVAPDLLAALRKIATADISDGMVRYELKEIAHAAVEKAEGS